MGGRKGRERGRKRRARPTFVFLAQSEAFHRDVDCNLQLLADTDVVVARPLVGLVGNARSTLRARYAADARRARRFTHGQHSDCKRQPAVKSSDLIRVSFSYHIIFIRAH